MKWSMWNACQNHQKHPQELPTIDKWLETASWSSAAAASGFSQWAQRSHVPGVWPFGTFAGLSWLLIFGSNEFVPKYAHSKAHLLFLPEMGLSSYKEQVGRFNQHLVFFCIVNKGDANACFSPVLFQTAEEDFCSKKQTGSKKRDTQKKKKKNISSKTSAPKIFPSSMCSSETSVERSHLHTPGTPLRRLWRRRSMASSASQWVLNVWPLVKGVIAQVHM